MCCLVCGLGLGLSLNDVLLASLQLS